MPEIALAVRVTPRARREEVTGAAADPAGRPALGVRLTAPPADGAANAALIRLLAKRWGLPQAALAIASGASARLKRLAVTADDAGIARVRADLAAHGLPGPEAGG